MKTLFLFFIHALASLPTFAQVGSDSEKPNIIFFFTDDQAYDTVGINGNDQVKTPHIDQLGKRGIVFDRHYNTTAICMASRANVMSGLYEYKAGCNFQHGPMGTKQWETSYPMLLKKAGYRIGFAGKFGFSVSNQKNIDLRGTEGHYAKPFFDDWKGGKGQTSYVTTKNAPIAKYAETYPHSSRAYGAATIDFIRDSVNAKVPFCMTVFFKAPHLPFDPDPYFDEVYRDTDWKRPENFGPQHGAHLSKQARSGRQARYFRKFYETDAKYQDSTRKYNQLIHGVDYAVGMIVKELEALGIANNTVIIFSSDNGYSQGAHGFGGKVLPYEEASKVPLIIYDPRLKMAGGIRRTDSITGNVDIAATILDLAGIAIPSFYDGKSLLPIVKNESATLREALPLIQVWGPESTRALAIVTKDYKYIYWYYGGHGKEQYVPTEELFHITQDVLEMENLAEKAEHFPVLEKMRKLYDAQVASWKAESVGYNGYQEYGQLLQRNLSWEKKAIIIQEKDSRLKGKVQGKVN